MLFYCFLKNKLLELKEINKFSFKLKKGKTKGVTLCNNAHSVVLTTYGSGSSYTVL